MTYLKDTFGTDLFRDFVGFDRFANHFNGLQKTIQKTTGFPFYNIRKDGDNQYAIEMALAGFGKQDITIDLDSNKLTIKAQAPEDTGVEYLFKGLTNRSFVKSFTLDDQVVVKNASMVNGILKVFLERIIPEGKKPRQINIEDEPSTVSAYVGKNTPQLLTEDHQDAGVLK